MNNRILFFILLIVSLSAVFASNVYEKNAESEYKNCHQADLISKDLPSNNEASPLEICFSNTGHSRRLRLYDSGKIKTEIIEPSPIHVRTRVFICSKYFLLSDGSDSINILGHLYHNTIFRISDGEKMASFSSLRLPENDCSIFVL